MAKKPLSDKVCQRRLTEWIKIRFTEEEQEVLAYYNDVMDDKSYKFIFDNPITGQKKVILSINRNTEEIRVVY